MAKRIEQLKLDAFRGATCLVDIEFDSKMPVTMIFGENSTGKSTIVDAIDFVCNGQIGSLEHRKLGKGHRKSTYIPSLGRYADEVRVELLYDGKTWTATHSKSGAVLCETPNRPRALIIRRAELLKFVDADPAERYEQLANFISVPGVEKAEQALRNKVKSAQSNVDEAARAVAQAEDALKTYWEAEGKPGKDALSWAREEAGKEAAELAASKAECDRIIKELQDLSVKAEVVTAVETKVSQTLESLKQASENLTTAEARLSEGSGVLLDVLNEARKYFANMPQAEVCPVCERGDIDVGVLSARLAERIKELNKLDSLKQLARQAKGKSDSASDALDDAQRQLANAAKRLAETLKKSGIREVTGLLLNWGDYPALFDDKVELADDNLLEQARALRKATNTLESTILDRRDAEQKIVNILSAVKQHVGTIDEKTANLNEWNELNNRFNAALQLVERERKAFVDDVLEMISKEVNELYQRVHPGELIGQLRMYLDPNQKGSLKFEGRFESEGRIQPQAYYSESHLDTLGVCIFLGLARHYAKEDTIVVLDDVFTSVDQPHLDRIISMIHDEGERFNHVILTTHYRPWRDRYRYYRGPALKIQTIDLLNWSINRGIRHTRTKLSIEDVKDWLDQEPLERQIVASKAGILLEALLDYVTLLYECRLPRRAGTSYTLGDLISGIDSKLLKALKVTKISADKDGNPVSDDIELKPLIDNVGSFAWVRNQVGCHFNLEGMEIADADVKSFGVRAAELAEALVCAECGELPKTSKNGIDRQCRCGKRRLQPLETP